MMSITDKQYTDFIMNEGKKIAKMIDEGKSYQEINDGLSKEHSGNTFGCAMAYGIGHAKDKKKSEEIRKIHNKKYGISGPDIKGVVNPAIMTLKVKKK
jgi:hypothetical protein